MEAVQVNLESYVNTAYPTLKNIVDKEKKSSVQKIALLIKSMEIVEDFTELTGSEKKEVALLAVEKVMNDILDEKIEDKEELELIINVVVMASRGLLHLNVKEVQGCLSKVFSCKKIKKN